MEKIFLDRIMQFLFLLLLHWDGKQIKAIVILVLLPTFCCALADNHSKLSPGPNTETHGSKTERVHGAKHWSHLMILKSWTFISLFYLLILLSFEQESITNECGSRKKMVVKKRVKSCSISPVYTFVFSISQFIEKQAQFLGLYPIMLSWVFQVGCWVLGLHFHP